MLAISCEKISHGKAYTLRALSAGRTDSCRNTRARPKSAQKLYTDNLYYTWCVIDRERERDVGFAVDHRYYCHHLSQGSMCMSQ